MTEVERVGPEYVRERLDEAEGPLLVCAYRADSPCEQYGLESAIPLAELSRREGSLEEGQELLFYCD